MLGRVGEILVNFLWFIILADLKIVNIFILCVITSIDFYLKVFIAEVGVIVLGKYIHFFNYANLSWCQSLIIIQKISQMRTQAAAENVLV